MKSLEQRKKQLTSRLAELDKRLETIETTLDIPVDADVEERATEREADEMLEDLGFAGQREIQMINAALERIEDGTYGECVKCGEPVTEERLDLLPATPFCRTCAV